MSRPVPADALRPQTPLLPEVAAHWEHAWLELNAAREAKYSALRSMRDFSVTAEGNRLYDEQLERVNVLTHRESDCIATLDEIVMFGNEAKVYV